MPGPLQARITVDINYEWLGAARKQLGTDSKVATINAALEFFAFRHRTSGIVAAFADVAMDFEGSDHAWGLSQRPGSGTPGWGRPRR